MAKRESSIHVWALFNHFYPNFSGAAIQGRRNLSRLSQQGFTVTVLAARDHAAADLKEIELDGLTIRYLRILQHHDWAFVPTTGHLRRRLHAVNHWFSSFTLGLSAAWMLFRQGKRGDIVQLYSLNEFSFIVTWLAKQRGMHPVIRTTLLGLDDPMAKRGIRGILRRSTFRYGEAVVNISSALEKSCLKSGLSPNQVFLIPNGMDTTTFRPVSRAERGALCQRFQLDASRRYIVFVGATIERKGIDILIDAFLDIQARLGDVDLLLVGPNNFEDITRFEPTKTSLVIDLKDKLEAAGCADRVHWVGEVENVNEYMQVGAVFCLPTRREGLGTVIAEAMATGLPVITSLLPDVTTDMVHPEENDGILIDQPEPTLYAEALLEVLTDSAKAKAMGEIAREHAQARFDLEIIVGRYAQLYRKLSEGH